MTLLSENRRASFDYEILEKFQAGLVLTGQEVKSAKLGRMQIRGSYVVPRQSQAWLVGATIPPYQPKNASSNYLPQRSRKLLLKKRELEHLAGKIRERGLTAVPLRVYTNAAGRVKLEFALAKGKKTWDKREAIRKREAELEIRRAME